MHDAGRISSVPFPDIIKASDAQAIDPDRLSFVTSAV